MFSILSDAVKKGKGPASKPGERRIEDRMLEAHDQPKFAMREKRQGKGSIAQAQRAAKSII